MRASHLRARLLGLATAALFAGAAHAVPINFVPNGDFELGNTLFTSAYQPYHAENTAEGQYTVRSNPYPWNPEFVSTDDHTPGLGTMMMVANGSPESGAVVWQSQAITVTAGTNYFFEAFVNNVCCRTLDFGPGSASILEFSISLNGVAATSLGTITTNLDLAGTWEGLSPSQYQPIDAGTVVLSLINRNTNAGGNDFAIDDVFFGTESIVNPSPVPEPLTQSLLGIALAGLAFSRRKRPTVTA